MEKGTVTISIEEYDSLRALKNGKSLFRTKYYELQIKNLQSENNQLKQDKLEILLQFKNMSVWDFLRYRKAANKGNFNTK